MTFVFQELRRQASWGDLPIAFHDFRDKDGAEVDIVLEWGGQELAGIEVAVASIGKRFTPVVGRVRLLSTSHTACPSTASPPISR